MPPNLKKKLLGVQHPKSGQNAQPVFDYLFLNNNSKRLVVTVDRVGFKTGLSVDLFTLEQHNLLITIG